MAATTATATTDLNVRAGPGSQYPVVGVIGAGQATVIDGCIQGSKWCSVANEGGKGWVFSDYLTAEFGGSPVVLSSRPADSGVSVVTAPTGDVAAGTAAVGAAGGAITGAIVGGPVGAAVGGLAGAAIGGTAGSIAEPPGAVRTYVTSHKVAPVYLEGEAVVGAGLPANVELREIPNYKYRYVNVNGQPVLVEPSSRKIVYVMR